MEPINQVEFDAVVVVASRKAELYINLKKKLFGLLPQTVDKQEAMSQLRAAISTLDNMLFIAGEEKTSKRINPKTNIADLKIDRQQIINQILEKIGFS